MDMYNTESYLYSARNFCSPFVPPFVVYERSQDANRTMYERHFGHNAAATVYDKPAVSTDTTNVSRTMYNRPDTTPQPQGLNLVNDSRQAGLNLVNERAQGLNLVNDTTRQSLNLVNDRQGLNLVAENQGLNLVNNRQDVNRSVYDSQRQDSARITNERPDTSAAVTSYNSAHRIINETAKPQHSNQPVFAGQEYYHTIYDRHMNTTTTTSSASASANPALPVILEEPEQKPKKRRKPTGPRKSKQQKVNNGPQLPKEKVDVKISKQNLENSAAVLRMLPISNIAWNKMTSENLNLDYGCMYSNVDADLLVEECERQLQYHSGQLSKVQIFGRQMELPRKQVAMGDPGLTYSMNSSTRVLVKPWIPMIARIRNQIQEVTGHRFNFVLISRYKDGADYMAEHREDERDFEFQSPIASLSLGQPRDFVFRHYQARGKTPKRNIDIVKLLLEHGSLLMMHYPTNMFWYHSLPRRKKAQGVRINMTFRKKKMFNHRVAAAMRDDDD